MCAFFALLCFFSFCTVVGVVVVGVEHCVLRKRERERERSGNGLYCSFRWSPLFWFIVGSVRCSRSSILCMFSFFVFLCSVCVFFFCIISFHSLCFTRKFTSIANLFGMWNSSALRCYICALLFFFPLPRPKWSFLFLYLSWALFVPNAQAMIPNHTHTYARTQIHWLMDILFRCIWNIWTQGYQETKT